MWTYNNIRIYVQDFDSSQRQIIARLQPLNTTTVRQIFGDESPIIKIQGKVVGLSNLNSLAALINDGTAYTLSGYDLYNQSLYLSSLVYKIDNSMYQTIDPLQDCEAPVYTVTMEFQ